MKKTEILIGFPRITAPNMKGIIVKETPKMIIVELTGYVFKTKGSATGNKHIFRKAEREYFNGWFKPHTRRYWKQTGKRVGYGDDFIVK
jgi:hypothetical protein